MITKFKEVLTYPFVLLIKSFNSTLPQDYLHWYFLLPLMYYVSYQYFQNPDWYILLVSDLNLVIHEAGHIFTMWQSNFEITAFAGTFLQLFVPLSLGVMLIGRKFYFEASFFSIWLGTNIMYIQMYMLDAIKQELPMFGLFGPDSVHDWYFLFYTWGGIDNVEAIARNVRNIGYAVMILACVYATSLLLYRIVYSVRKAN